jgi:hypothetical protein
LKSGSLNLLEPSGPVQVCNGIALHKSFFDEMKLTSVHSLRAVAESYL